MVRRGNGEGNVRQRPSGTWEASVSFDGRRFYARRNSQAEARRALAELKQQYAAAELVAPSRVTVAQHLAAWMEANAGNWRPSTSAGYEGIVRNYLAPAWGSRKLQSLTAADIAQQYGRWRKAGVGARTLAIIHARLHRALRQAVLWGSIPRNPADSVEPPRSTYRRPELWTVEQTKAFVASLDGADWHGTLAALMLGGGLRLGEAVGLQWADADLDSGVVSVARTRTLLHGRFVEGEPKTVAGNRSVTLPAFSVAALRAWKRVQSAQRLSTGPGWSGESRIVTLPDGTTPSRTQASYRLAARAKAAGLPALRNHDLRHLSASLALSAGVTLPDVSRRLGHANVSVTATIYAHALIRSDAHIAAALARTLESA